MGTVALLKSWKDSRNLATLALATILITAAVHALRTRSSALTMVNVWFLDYEYQIFVKPVDPTTQVAKIGQKISIRYRSR